MRLIFFNIVICPLFRAFVQFYMSQKSYDFNNIICDLHLLMIIIYSILPS